MIIDDVANISKYAGAIPLLSLVSEILLSEDFTVKESGTYQSSDPRLRYKVLTYETEGERAEIYEVHRSEADVQIILSGSEVMDVAHRANFQETVAYESEIDAAFGTGKFLLSYRALPGSFVLFFPGEPHGPNLIDGKSMTVKKLVFKILME